MCVAALASTILRAVPDMGLLAGQRPPELQRKLQRLPCLRPERSCRPGSRGQHNLLLVMVSCSLQVFGCQVRTPQCKQVRGKRVVVGELVESRQPIKHGQQRHNSQTTQVQ